MNIWVTNNTCKRIADPAKLMSSDQLIVRNMVNDSSKVSGISIVSLILGSGVIVFGANVIYSDFIKQPHLVLEIRPRDLAVAVSLINTGITTAHNVRETLSSNATQITNHIFESVPDEQINFTNLDRPQGLVLNASRLTPGDKFTTDEDILRARTTR